MTLYQDGILRVVINEVERMRFRISDLGIGVEEKQLRQMRPMINNVLFLDGNFIIQSSSEDGQDQYEYKVLFKPFRIEQRINKHLVTIVNHRDTLFFENSKFAYDYSSNPSQQEFDQDCFNKVLNNLNPNVRNKFFKIGKFNDYMNPQADFREGFGVGFFVSSYHVFGLPERSDSFQLKTTQYTDPYRLYNVDVYPHDTYQQEGLYSSLPYITGHSSQHDESIVYINAAETWIDIFDQTTKEEKNGKLINFMTESGALEFFLIGSASDNAPKKVQKKLATITGFQYFPPFFSLGFHYSKWEQTTSASKIIDYNNKFEIYNFPVDVFWMDIPYTENNKYFEFNSKKFQKGELEKMKNEIQESNRRLVVITDPHIRQDENYTVFKNGNAKTNKWEDGKYTNIWVQSQPKQTFIGYCWPGNSAYVDFLNEGARQFWRDQYKYDHFQGTNNLFNIWIDMNEPSVFNGPENSLPKNSLHYLSNGQRIQHKDIHNSYGRLMIEATYDGMIQREEKAPRPFILTRSAFFGSQKYGAKWTGDNQATFDELKVSIPQLLSLGISGMQFVGADIPGFAGNPTQELYGLFYQLGMFYPFFRGHGHIDFKRREPYYQSEEVQQIVRKTLFLRYELIHYLYTLFYISSTEGLPIMRPMWQEFAKDENTFNLEYQFMWGDKILVAPKIDSANPQVWNSSDQQDYHYLTTLYLPSEVDWYCFYTKQIEYNSGTITKVISKQEQGIYVQAGSILPLMLHQNQLSLLRIINNPIRLELYLDQNNKAEGILYLDDGESFNYQQNNERTLIQFEYNNGVLLSRAILQDAYYAMASEIVIQEIVIFGIQDEPQGILDLSKVNRGFQARSIEYSYNNSNNALTISNLNIAIDEGDMDIVYGGRPIIQLQYELM